MNYHSNLFTVSELITKEENSLSKGGTKTSPNVHATVAVVIGGCDSNTK